jgi:beta-lactamase regulating signal transducer with metallopeptidase domain/predicted esterase
MAVCPLVTYSILPSHRNNQPPVRLFDGPRLKIDRLDDLVADRGLPKVPGETGLQNGSAAAGVVPDSSERAVRGWQYYAPIGAATYLVGVSLFLARLGLGLRGAGRLRRTSEPVDDDTVLDVLVRQTQAVGLRAAPALAQCRDVIVPTVIGVLRPTILLPIALVNGLSVGQLEVVLAHELAHIRRYDHWVNLVQRVVESFLFFHPAVWWLSRAVRVEREHCCDEIAVKAGNTTRIGYAGSLLEVANLCRAIGAFQPMPNIAAVRVLDTPSRLRLRVARLLGEPVEPMIRLQSSSWLSVLVAAVLALGAVAVLRDRAIGSARERDDAVRRLELTRGIDRGDERFAELDKSTLAGSDLHVVGCYGAGPSFDRMRVEVTVCATEKPIVLALTAYHSVIWSIKLAEAAKVEAVVVAGYFEQRVEGLPDSLPVVWRTYFPIDRESPRGKGAGVNKYFWAYEQKSREYANAMFELHEMTGLRPRSFQGEYMGRLFVVDGLRGRLADGQDRMPGSESGSRSDTAQRPKEATSGRTELPVDVADVPANERVIGDDAMKRYLLIGSPEREQGSDSGFKLLVVLPGGDGGTGFHPFLRRVYKNVLNDSWLVAALVPPQWDDAQFNQVVWPTAGLKYPAARFTTEQFIEAVVSDVRTQAKIDPARVFLLGWSSGGPACYAAVLQEDSVAAGAFIAMSVFKTNQLPPLARARGRMFYLLQSPEDRVTPFWFAQSAEQSLGAAGSVVRLDRYAGGHGWHGDVWSMMRGGVSWLDQQASVRDGNTDPKAKSETSSGPAQSKPKTKPAQVLVVKREASSIKEAMIVASARGREPEAVHEKVQQTMRLQAAAGERVPSGGWLTDQETIVSADQPEADGNTVKANVILMSLPEGSGLRAELVGESIEFRRDQGKTKIVIRGGQVRLVDDSGVARAVAFPTLVNNGALSVEAWTNDGDETVLQVLNTGPHLAAPVRVELDWSTGVPTDEKQPPHGAVRYRLLRRDAADKRPTQFKMQWIYDLEILKRDADAAQPDKSH